MPQYIDRPEVSQIQETPWTKLLSENRSLGSVLYYFSSESCKFCNDASPFIDAIQEKYKDVGLSILAVDINRSPSIAGSAGVTGVPVLIMTQDGSPINRVVGWSNDMDTEIESNLGLTDLYGKSPGLRGDQPSTASAAAGEKQACEGCGKEENPAVAELAVNISNEIEQLRSEIEKIKASLNQKVDR